jgi:hypothetical protein
MIFPGHELLIIEFINGRLLKQSDFSDVTINKKLGAIYSQIWSIPMRGYGWLNEDFIGMHCTWIDFLVSIDNIELIIDNKTISKRELDWLINEFHKTSIRKFEPCLLHGDFKWTNFIANKDNIAVIDFQNCFSGHYLYDIGIGVFFQPLILSNLAYYLSEFNNRNYELSTQEYKLIVLYGMRHAISVMGHRVAVNDKDGIKEAKSQYAMLKKIYQSIGL